MNRKTLVLCGAWTLLFATHAAWASMTNAQAKALAVTVAQHPKSKLAVAALTKLDNAANAGVSAAQFWRGLLSAVHGHFAKARYWYRSAAKQGNAPAESALGGLYYIGKGAPKDYAKAFHWYKRAAEQGDKFGEFGLGHAYYRGEGVTRSYSKALYWYKKAAAQGSELAKAGITLIHAHEVMAESQQLVGR